MKWTRMFAVVGGILMVLWLSGNVFAFHEGGVAHCDGCHSMHNSVNGMPDPDVNSIDGLVGVGDTGKAILTKGSDPSSTCLNCHEGFGSYHIASNDPTRVNYTSGGDFSWVKVSEYSWTRHNEAGANFGHSIRAFDFGYTEDSENLSGFSPGGDYPVSALGCTSCHDPHGKVQGGGTGPIANSGSYGDPDPGGGLILGNYRLLGDSKYVASSSYNMPSNLSPYPFTKDAPIAAAANQPSNIDVGGVPTPTDRHYGYRVAYGSGMSEWCSNCHKNFVADGALSHRHPASNGAHLDLFYNNYNQYVSTGDMSGARGYDPMVPIESGETIRSNLDPDNPALAGPSSNVMCLTCHRAHASGFTNMTRWDMTTELLANSHPTVGDGGYQLTDPHAGYYVDGASFDPTVRYNPEQRSLCNKCHVQD
jgi:predicted CXXCH cytochrome family protein